MKGGRWGDDGGMMVGAPTVEDGGKDESEKVCESGP